MATMDCFEAVLDYIQLKCSAHSLDMLSELKVQLRLVRTFYMCGRKLGKEVEMHCESTLLSIEKAVSRIASRTGHSAFFFAASEFLASVGSFGREIQDLYAILSDGSLPTCSPHEDELVDVINTLLDSFQDLPFEDLPGEFRKAVDALEEDVRFAKNFVCFVRLRGLQHSQLEALLSHIGGFVVNASRLTFMSWVNEDDRCDLPGKISGLLQKFKSVEHPVFEIYARILKASKSSEATQVSTPECDNRVFGTFVDSLLGYLWELLHSNTSFMVSSEHQMLKFYEELGFLRTMFDEPREKLHDSIGVVICEAGIVICSLFMKANDEALLGRLDNQLLDLIEKLRLIKEVEYPLATATYVPQTTIEEVQGVAETSLEMPSLSQEVNDFVLVLHDELAEIIDRLTRGRKSLDVISIVGMPGLGKTTLARRIYKDPSILRCFHRRFWCTVSQAYNLEGLLREILSQIDFRGDVEEYEFPGERVRRCLKGRKYLIILDDVWDSAVWHCLRGSFPDDSNGSRILLTSRLRHVALQIDPDGEPHPLRLLTNDESWELLREKIFGHEHYCPPALHELGMQIAQDCKGLPLMIVLAAGILARTERDAWKEVAKSVINDISDQCKNIVETSYYHLPNYLKSCFLYFGLFPQGAEIRVQRLLWLWIANGFVMENKYKSLEDVAEEYMMGLIGRNLVMVAKRGSRGNVNACNLHDLIHDFCVARGKEEHFLQYLGLFDESSVSSGPCVHSTREHFAKERMLCPRARSLHISADQSPYRGHWYNAFYTLHQFKLLTVLDMWGVSLLKSFPSEIELLVHLRYLAIDSSIPTIPPSIENLSSLETFILYGGQVSLPDTIWSMKKLRHLYLTGRGYWKLPEGDLQETAILENLDTLSWVYVSKYGIWRKFPNIRRLKCKLFIEADCIGDCQFQLPGCLKKLVLSKLFLPWSQFPAAIWELPQLEVLKLHENAFTGQIWVTEEAAFTGLQFLELEDLDLVRWMGSDSDSFPCLEKLMLRRCKNLIEVPDFLGSSYSLDRIHVFDCNSAVVSSIKHIQEQLEGMEIRVFP